ncbi:MAG: acyltransferase [Patescibacteria group bacterium]
MRDVILQKLRRVTSSSLFIPEIDGLRFLAIAWVVLFHIDIFIQGKNPFLFTTSPDNYPLLSIFLSNGSRGVELFFVISGFILALPFAKKFIAGMKDVNIKAYFLRRLTRLEPPYIFNMILCFVFLVLIGKYNAEEIWSSLLASLVYLHNILPVGPSVNGVAWSLEIEVQFYILAPLLSCVFFLSKNIRRGVIAGAIIILIYLQSTYQPFSFLTLYDYIQYFLIGFLLADIYLEKPSLSISRWASIVVGLALLGIIFYINIGGVGTEILLLLAIFCLYVLALNDHVWRGVFSTWWITLIGGMCYTIYLWHYVVISFIGNKSILFFSSESYITTLIVQGLIYIPAVLVVSTIFYMLIERPCMDKTWPKKLIGFFRKNLPPDRSDNTTSGYV